MAYRSNKEDKSIVIDGFENGIAPSPYLGISNIRNLNTNYYPGVAYVNYSRQAATINGIWYAGIHSTNVSNNTGWIFTAQGTGNGGMTNPVQKTTSPSGLSYILDDSGQIWKQSAVNSTTFNKLGGGSGRLALGASGIVYWNNYLAVFGAGLIEFCGDGTGDSGITDANWNLNNISPATNTAVFTVDFVSSSSQLLFSVNPSNLPRFQINDPVQFTTTGTLPASLVLNTTYYIKSIDYSSSFITISTSVGGSTFTFTSNGTGTHTITDYSTPLPIGNVTSLVLSFSSVIGATTATITSYIDTRGVTVLANWQGATGVYNVVMADGQKLAAAFTNGSATITFLAPIVYLAPGARSAQLLDTTVTNYKPYVSKADGNLYFANGRYLGRILAQNSNINFNPGLASTYDVNFGVASLLQQTDTITDMTDLNSTLVVSGQKDMYTWDYTSPTMTAPSPVGEQIFTITNLLNNVYILAGQKGNIYISNGYSAQLFYKIPDFIAGVIDPVWSWGGFMVHRSKLFFQVLAKNTSGTNLLAGVFSLIVSPPAVGSSTEGLVMEAQNSYGLTPASGALSGGVLIDNSPSANGNDSYYSAWSNGATTGGIDYNDTTLWQNFEPTIETDIIPIGTILDKKTMGNIQFKLDRPMASGDQIRMYWRPSLTDSYVLMGTTTTTQLSEYYPSNISQSQWAQFKIQMKCAPSSSSFIPLREIRIHYD